MDPIMNKEESYAERRKLFKNIWETAMTIEDKDGEIITKPKVIKTLRLDEVDRCSAGKKKKQRIKNLRTVCNRILDFCDRQDADDLFYEQMTTEVKEPPTQEDEPCTKKVKHHKVKRRIKKAKSMLPSSNAKNITRVTASERNDDFPRAIVTKTSRNTSPIKIKRTSLTYATNRSFKTKKKMSNASNIVGFATLDQKVSKKKRSQTDRPADLRKSSPGYSRWRYNYAYIIKTSKRANPISNKTVFPIHKINIM